MPNLCREYKILLERSINYCEISDNAGGIKDEIKEKVFEPYFTTKEGHGTGIGLYISKEIIQKHMKGTLKVKNIKDGASFIVSIPIVKEVSNGNSKKA